jgi:hypothetical protein
MLLTCIYHIYHSYTDEILFQNRAISKQLVRLSETDGYLDTRH